jgi:hypothetical protein
LGLRGGFETASNFFKDITIKIGYTTKRIKKIQINKKISYGLAVHYR